MPKRAQRPSTHSSESEDVDHVEDVEEVEDELEVSTSEHSGSEEDSEDYEDIPTALEAVESVTEICARIRFNSDQLDDEFKEVQTATVALLDVVGQEMQLLGKSIEDQERLKKDPSYNDENIASMVLIVKDSLESLEEAVSSLGENEDEDIQSQISSVLDSIRDCYEAIPGKGRNSSLASGQKPSASLTGPPSGFPSLPSHQFFGRSEVLRLGVDHLTSSSLPPKILISGEDGSGKTAVALQLLHNKKVRAFFGDGHGCWYLDCAPLCERAGQKPGGGGVALVIALLQLLEIDLHPSEKDLLGFLYKKLVAMGSRMKMVMVLDGLHDVVSPEGKDEEGLTMKKVIETLGSLYCCSLVVISGDEELRPLLPWTMILPEKGGLGPLEMKFAVKMFESVLQVENIGAPSRDDIVALLDLQPANRLPLGIMLLARMQKFHDGPTDTCQCLEETREAAAENPAILNDGIGLIFQTLLSSVVSTTKTTNDAPRLLALLAFLPEGLPNYKKLLALLTNPEYLNFDVLFEPEASPDMLLKAGLVEKKIDAQGTETLVVQRTVKKYFYQPPSKVPWFSKDLYTVLRFIDRHRTSCATWGPALLLGPANIYRILEWTLMYKASGHMAQVALECCARLFSARSILNDEIMSMIRFVHETIIENVEKWKESGEEDYDIDEERKHFLTFLLRYATWLEQLNRSAKSRQIAQEAIKLSETIADQVSVGEALITQGQAFQQDDHYDDAYASFERASKIFESSGEAQEISFARTLTGMASIHRLRGRYTKAIEDYERAIVIFKKQGELVYLGDAVYGLGVAFKMVGKEEEALKQYDEVVKLATESRNTTVVAAALNSMGVVLIKMGKHAAAMEKFESAYDIFKKIPNQMGMARALDNIGEGLRGAKRYEEAIAKHQEAYTIFKSFGDLLGMGNALDNWAISLRKLDRTEEAVKKLEEALALFKRANLPRSTANTLHQYGEVLFLLERDSDAISAYQEAHDLFTELGMRVWAGNCKRQQGIAYQFSGLITDAVMAFIEAYGHYLESGEKEGVRDIEEKLLPLGVVMHDNRTVKT